MYRNSAQNKEDGLDYPEWKIVVILLDVCGIHGALGSNNCNSSVLSIIVEQEIVVDFLLHCVWYIL